MYNYTCIYIILYNYIIYKSVIITTRTVYIYIIIIINNYNIYIAVYINNTSCYGSKLLEGRNLTMKINFITKKLIIIIIIIMIGNEMKEHKDH